MKIFGVCAVGEFIDAYCALHQWLVGTSVCRRGNPGHGHMVRLLSEEASQLASVGDL